jgi:hypothetical protein
VNGLEAAPLLRQMLPAVPVILFTLHDNNRARLSGILEVGTNGKGEAVVISRSCRRRAISQIAAELRLQHNKIQYSRRHSLLRPDESH